MHFLELEIVVRTCGNVFINETCEIKQIESKGSKRKLNICYVSCLSDGCNEANQLKASYYFLILFSLFQLKIFLK